MSDHHLLREASRSFRARPNSRAKVSVAVRARAAYQASQRVRRFSCSLLAGLFLAACGGAQGKPEWPPSAQKWYDRAAASLRAADIDDAQHAAESALKELPQEEEVRILAARVALARLDFARALQLTQGIVRPDAAGIRGRAYWYQGDIEKAADELEALARNPDVRDPWAKEVAELARLGRGRRPFEMSGGVVAATEMPRAGSTAMIVPLEINGEPGLALVATDVSEAAIDTKEGKGSWISLRFGGRIEVSDVPAIGRDLSGLKREIGAPIKLLIGVNLLRHLNATIDFSGSQFVVRNFDAPPPPDATTLHPVFYRGGALVLPTAFGAEAEAPRASLLLNTSMTFPIALDEAGWKKGGQDPKRFVAVPGQSQLTFGTLSLLKLGAFQVPSVPGVYGARVDELEKAIEADLDGFAGSGLFQTFRLTFAQGGRTLWIEDLPPEVVQARLEVERRLSERFQRERAAREASVASGGAAGSAPVVPGSSPAVPGSSPVVPSVVPRPPAPRTKAVP